MFKIRAYVTLTVYDQCPAFVTCIRLFPDGAPGNTTPWPAIVPGMVWANAPGMACTGRPPGRCVYSGMLGMAIGIPGTAPGIPTRAII